MVRWLPPPPPPPSAGELVLGHDAVALSFFVACVAATVALTSSMCSACGRKPKPAANADPAASDQPAGTGSVSGGSEEAAGAGEGEEEVVRLSPELATHGAIDPVALPSSTSKRRLSISVSKKLSMNIPDKLRLSRREHKDHHHKVESEDTLWKKGIILGEKCRIPGERETELGDPVDPADEVAAGSFRRSSYSRPVSRSSSFAMYQQPQHDAPALHASDS
ncbi:hypothetical protein BDA96_10G046800 [Sorghum bicolor]|jgi:hypothetical protein|uniref:Uncharacterized protein n=2 Tax=Sorghum bicolor TaxID=4558 RepID=A0A921Q0W4_SORBI|nr:uncharacterized protein LOC8071323 [Sorghum bicolor]EER89208.1 hypothetical protein SORBI_3010G040000 [Sorghum bicolor]KAG0512813.1 hypothetical protein BDA96_10G046800 [Sorghum bicolor]|eukprot:XP_002437841.1 uncharacterized protein LOC8071323 [Sorghum bicolor]